MAASPIPPGRDVIGGGGSRTATAERACTRSIATMACCISRPTGGRPGGGLITELVEVKYPTGQRFERKKVSRAGDHCLINRKGDLELRDKQGLISVCKKVQ